MNTISPIQYGAISIPMQQNGTVPDYWRGPTYIGWYCQRCGCLSNPAYHVQVPVLRYYENMTIDLGPYVVYEMQGPYCCHCQDAVLREAQERMDKKDKECPP